MSANDYFIACQIWRSADANHGCWEVINARTQRRAAGPFDTAREATAKADELNGEAFLRGGQYRGQAVAGDPATIDTELDDLGRVA